MNPQQFQIRPRVSSKHRRGLLVCLLACCEGKLAKKAIKGRKRRGRLFGRRRERDVMPLLPSDNGLNGVRSMPRPSKPAAAGRPAVERSAWFACANRITLLACLSALKDLGWSCALRSQISSVRMYVCMYACMHQATLPSPYGVAVQGSEHTLSHQITIFIAIAVWKNLEAALVNLSDRGRSDLPPNHPSPPLPSPNPGISGPPPCADVGPPIRSEVELRLSALPCGRSGATVQRLLRSLSAPFSPKKSRSNAFSIAKSSMKRVSLDDLCVGNFAA